MKRFRYIPATDLSRPLHRRVDRNDDLVQVSSFRAYAWTKPGRTLARYRVGTQNLLGDKSNKTHAIEPGFAGREARPLIVSYVRPGLWLP